MHEIALSVAGNTREEAEGGESLAAASRSGSCAGEERRKACRTESPGAGTAVGRVLPLKGRGWSQLRPARSLGGDSLWGMWPRRQRGGGSQGATARATGPLTPGHRLGAWVLGAAPAGKSGGRLLVSGPGTEASTLTA